MGLHQAVEAKKASRFMLEISALHDHFPELLSACTQSSRQNRTARREAADSTRSQAGIIVVLTNRAMIPPKHDMVYRTDRKFANHAATKSRYKRHGPPFSSATISVEKSSTSELHLKKWLHKHES